jgi:hypothetical protein
MQEACTPHHSKLKVEAFATIIPGRRPPVKCHAGIGLAKLAIGYSDWGGVRGGEIYKRTENGWELLFRVESGTPAAGLSTTARSSTLLGTSPDFCPVARTSMSGTPSSEESQCSE